jgi:hypothetical protein
MIWKFITDLSTAPWSDKGLTEWKQTPAGPLGVGTTPEAKHPNLTCSERIIEYEPNRRLTLEITSGPAKGTGGTFKLEANEQKTRLTETTDYKFCGFYKLVGPFIASNAKRESADRV